MSEPKIGVSRVKKTIDKINKELKDYEISPITTMNGRRIDGSILGDALQSAIVGVRKGLRFLKGDPPISNLKKRKEKLNRMQRQQAPQKRKDSMLLKKGGKVSKAKKKGGAPHNRLY